MIRELNEQLISINWINYDFFNYFFLIEINLELPKKLKNGTDNSAGCQNKLNYCGTHSELRKLKGEF